MNDVPDLSVVRDRLAAARSRIAEVTDRPVRIVAVTKTHGWEVVDLAMRAGVEDVAENYAQELVAKARDVAANVPGAEPRWHFIGRLQSNKVRSIAGLVSCWESIDRSSVADEVARRRPGARVMVQLDLAGLEGRGGCAPSEAPGLVGRCRTAGLDVVGLMGVGPPGEPEHSRPAFRRLVALADELGLPERSIGMSGDFVVAAEEGATSVRLGTALFGPRPVR